MARGTVDFRMGGVLIAGGVVGAGLGVLIFRMLQVIGQIDTVIGILYVLMLGGIGSLMAKESIQALVALKTGRKIQARTRRQDRKSGGEGKSVSVGVTLGGRR